jgi:hypothetical protein
LILEIKKIKEVDLSELKALRIDEDLINLIRLLLDPE